MTQTIENRAYGVDVSSFNNANVTEYTNAGANFVLVKVSEGLDYRNPKAKAQVERLKKDAAQDVFSEENIINEGMQLFETAFFLAFVFVISAYLLSR